MSKTTVPIRKAGKHNEVETSKFTIESMLRTLGYSAILFQAIALIILVTVQPPILV